MRGPVVRRAQRLLAVLALPLLGAAEPPARADAPSPPDARLLDVMRAELERTLHELSLPGAARPYFAGYWVLDAVERSATASFGSVVSDETSDGRYVKVELRVGTREEDNSNFGGGASLDGDFVSDDEVFSPRRAPRDDDPLTLRRELWLATDLAYKTSVETLEKKRAARQTEIAARGEVASFSGDRSAVYVGKDPAPRPTPDLAGVAARVSAVFRGFPGVQSGDVRVVETTSRRRFVSSDGGLVVEPARVGGMHVSCSGQAADGMLVERSAFVPPGSDGTPDEVSGTATAARLSRELTALLSAPVVEDYTGPVLFEGQAAAQLAYELLGESLSGTPPPEGNDDQEKPFARRLGKRILPRAFDVLDDPTLTELDGVPLLGHYHVDDEGISGARTQLVQEGLLRTFLMSRAPREGVEHSNGHGRSGLVGWARGGPSNLIVSARGGLPRQALRARLLAAVREEGEAYGIVVTALEPRSSASSGSVVPPVQLAYKVAPDGTETLVRGASLGSMTVRTLKDVLAVGSTRAVYGFVTERQGGLDAGTSVVAPPLLIEDVEVRGPTTPNKRPPVVPRPTMPERR